MVPTGSRRGGRSHFLPTGKSQAKSGTWNVEVRERQLPRAFQLRIIMHRPVGGGHDQFFDHCGGCQKTICRIAGTEVCETYTRDRTAEAWYRFLNLGVPIALEAGTDVMTDYYRTMPIGTTRLYVHTGGATNFDAYWRGLREGRSFVTTGPMLQFTVDDARGLLLTNSPRSSTSTGTGSRSP